MTLEYELTLDDFKAFNSYHYCLSPRKKESRIVWRIIGLLAFPILIYSHKGLNFETYGTPEIVILSFGVVLVLTMNYSSKWVSNLQVNNFINSGKNKDLLGYKKITIDEEKLSELSKFSNTEVRWVGFETFEEGKNHFFLYISVNQAIVIPKRAFQNSEEINNFRRNIQSNLNHTNALVESI